MELTKAYRICIKCKVRFEVGKDSSHGFRCGNCRRKTRRECQKDYVKRNPGRRSRKSNKMDNLQVTACRYWFDQFHKKSHKTCEMAFANAIVVTCDRVVGEAMKDESRRAKFDELITMGTMNGIMLSPHGPKEAV